MLGSAGPPAEPAERQSASSVLQFISAAGLGRPDDTSRTGRELFHQALLEKAPDVVFTLSPEGVITSLNPAFDRITGWPAFEWIGRTFLALVHPDDHPVVTTLLRRAGRGDDLPMFELRLRTSSGTHINAQFTTTPLFDGEEPGGLLGMARDVTEQKRIEEALRQRGSILEAVAFAAQRLAGASSWTEAIGQVLARLGEAAQAHRVALYMNERNDDGRWVAVRRHEWTAPGLQPRLGTAASATIDFAASGLGRWAEVLGSGAPIHGPLSAFPPEEREFADAMEIRSLLVVPIWCGQEWWGSVGLSDTEDERDWSATEIDALTAAAGVIGASIQRDRSAEALREAEDRYRRLVELSPDGIAIHKQGVVVFANDGAARVMGAESPLDLIGRSVLSFIHPDSRPAALERLQRLREGSPVAPVQEKFVRLDGSTVDVEVAATPFVHEGEPAVQVVVRDISDRLQTDRALRESEERYRRLVEVSPDAILVHSGGRFVFANAAAARLLGAPGPEQIVGTQVMGVIHPELRESAASRMRREVDFGEIVQALEDRFVRFDGAVVEVEVTAMPMTFQGVKAGLIMARDITGRRQAEEALRQRNAYLGALHETALGLIDRLRLDELLEAIVARAGALIGTEHGFMYLASEAGSDHISVQVGTGMYRGWAGYRMPLGQGLAGRVWQTGRPMVIQDYATWEGAHPDWKGAGLHSAIGVPLTSGSEVVGVLGLCYTEPSRLLGEEEVDLLTRFAALASIALDNARLYTAVQRELQERRQAEEQLGATEAKYRTLVEQIPAISYIDSWSGPGTTVYISPQSEAILGITPEDWLADPELMSKTIHQDDHDRWREQTDRSDRTGEPFQMEYRIRARNGRIVWVRDEAILVRDEEGNPSFWQGVMFDITAAKAAEERLVEAYEQERDLAERLRSLDEMKTTFLHAVSHELRTPLSAIMGMALTLENDTSLLASNEGAELLGRIAANARKLNHLLSDLLDLDRLDRGILEPRRKQTDVAALVRRVLEEMELTSDRTVHVEAEPIVISLDGPKVERIVENLLANAARHTPAGTSLWLTVSGRDGGVEIVVEDEGAGVPEPLRHAIFEPFTQGPDAPTHSPGVGIGLSLVARLAALHGGRAWVQDRPGGGASFRVFLPGA